jgi:hypothetical protein
VGGGKFSAAWCQPVRLVQVIETEGRAGDDRAGCVIHTVTSP